MATKSTINLVRYFFYAGNTISKQRKQQLVALAYATARDQQLFPKEVLIRADVHNTTTINGRHVVDPEGWHGTFAFKNDSQLQAEYHVASHGYTDGKEDMVLKKATHTPEKPDVTPRRGGKVVWPDEKDLEEYEDSPIGHSHLP